jgi:hypothetical protein
MSEMVSDGLLSSEDRLSEAGKKLAGHLRNIEGGQAPPYQEADFVRILSHAKQNQAIEDNN